ncbi:MAG: LPS-assembly protein LptD [Thermodesulfobacteriota bacterium]
MVNHALSKTLFVLFFFGLLLILSVDAFSRDEFFQEDQPVEISADSILYNKENNTFYASGNVTVVQGGVSITADTIVFDRKIGIVTAEGHIEGRDEGGNLLNGDSLTIDVNENTSVIVNGKLFFKGENVHLTGDEMRKTGRETYELDRGTFTTCDCDEGERTAWSFYSKSADVTVGEYMKAWHNYFNIKDVPVLYFPYLTAPIKRERQTGFLSPEVGYSSLKGAKLDNAFYWAISRNTDATLFFDVETRRGLGTGLEYRYIRRRGSEGEFTFYYFKERDIARVRGFREKNANLSRPETAEEGRWRLRYIHREKAHFGLIFKADVNIVSDDEYLLDFGEGGERSLESLETTLSLSRSWNDYNLVAEFRIFDNLLVGDDKATLQRLPEVTFTRANQGLLGSPLYLSMGSSFVNFEREEGVKGQRVDIHPRLSLPMNPGGYVEITPSVAPRGTFYWSKRHTGGRHQDRFIYDAKVDMTTTFVKFASFSHDGDGLEKVRHTVRPRLTYTYIPDVRQDDLPSFDSSDRIGKKSEVAYSINSILTGRFKDGGGAGYRDFVYLDLSQSYSIIEATREITIPDDERRPFSDLKGELIIDPFEKATFTAKGKYDVYDKRMEDYDASVALKDGRGDRLDVSYRFIRDSNEFLDVSAGVRAAQSIDLSYRNRYSFDSRKSIETIYGAEYIHQCWNARFTYTTRLDENVFLLTINLLGIGKVGSFGSSFASE